MVEIYSERRNTPFRGVSLLSFTAGACPRGTLRRQCWPKRQVKTQVASAGVAQTLKRPTITFISQQSTAFFSFGHFVEYVPWLLFTTGLVLQPMTSLYWSELLFVFA